MGSGKSTVASQLGAKFAMPIVDVDDVIAESSGKSIEEIFNTEGEKHFRSLELSIIKDLSQNYPYLVSIGGGAVETPELTEILKQNGSVIWLNRSWDKLYPTIIADSNRPLVNNNTVEELHVLFINRCRLYKSLADYEIDTSVLSIDQVAQEVNNIRRKCES